MKLSLSIVTAAFASLAAADFWIYSEQDFTSDITSEHFKFYNSKPDCSDVTTGSIAQQRKDDVSGGKNGVRCEGCLDGDLRVIEFNNDMGHFTIYKDRNWEMVDLDDKVVGNCEPDDSHTYTCPIPPTGQPAQGGSIIFCTSEHNADAINS
ncbi:hypothetical protein FZEAL_1611 [Fusarium zealandicum]|uniref:Uncharacterized protein n=1 Tax=Fusarium zealandicum TaxID=1053134 RepID=A0A8H4UT72_9HYPO|nr:hypothetical protein FZEAL_1611 [Fusarium zealandicum]